MMLAQIANWIGAGALGASPFFIDLWQGKAMAITGLALLTIQAYKMRAYNLVALNAVGIAGYFWSLLA